MKQTFYTFNNVTRLHGLRFMNDCLQLTTARQMNNLPCYARKMLRFHCFDSRMPSYSFYHIIQNYYDKIFKKCISDIFLHPLCYPLPNYTSISNFDELSYEINFTNQLSLPFFIGLRCFILYFCHALSYI